MDAVYACDAMIWSSPTYHGSVSGSFKNALDWLILLAERDPPYLTNKPVGLVTTAGGVQGLQAINSMEFIVRALRGWSVPLVQPVAQSWRSFDRDGRLADDAVADQLRALGAEVVRAARQFRAEGTCDYADDQAVHAGRQLSPGADVAGGPVSAACSGAIIGDQRFAPLVAQDGDRGDVGAVPTGRADDRAPRLSGQYWPGGRWRARAGRSRPDAAGAWRDRSPAAHAAEDSSTLPMRAQVAADQRAPGPRPWLAWRL